MTPKQEAALRLALETFERMGHKDSIFAGEFNGEITALREALAEQPAQPCGYPYCGCNSKAWCKVEQQSGIKQVIELYDSPEQPAQQEVDWEKLYRLEVERKEALAAKYERDTGKKLTRIVPMTEQPAQQEPVAWATERAIQWLHDRGPTASITTTISKVKSFERPLPLYTSPPARKLWVGLTNDEIALLNADYPHPQGFARALEAKLREKNA